MRLIHAKKLYHPRACVDGEADLPLRLAHDLDADGAGGRDALAGVGCIGEGLLDERPAPPRCAQQRRRAVAVLHAAGMGVSTSARPSVSPREPPASVVFVLWLSISAAVGLASRPARSRSRMTTWWFSASSTPPSRSRANQR